MPQVNILPGPGQNAESRAKYLQYLQDNFSDKQLANLLELAKIPKVRTGLEHNFSTIKMGVKFL